MTLKQFSYGTFFQRRLNVGLPFFDVVSTLKQSRCACWVTLGHFLKFICFRSEKIQNPMREVDKKTHLRKINIEHNFEKVMRATK